MFQADKHPHNQKQNYTQWKLTIFIQRVYIFSWTSLQPIYKDPALNNRFTKPAFAEHVPQNVKTKADPETEGGLDLHRVTDTSGKEQPDEHYHSPSECTSEYHLLEKQNSTSEETAGLEEDQPYFILEENDTNSANRDVTIALDNERKVLHTEK